MSELFGFMINCLNGGVVQLNTGLLPGGTQPPETWLAVTGNDQRTSHAHLTDAEIEHLVASLTKVLATLKARQP